MGGDDDWRFQVCPANAAAVPWVCDRGRNHAGAGDWGEYGDFLAPGPDIVAAASGEESPAIGNAYDAGTPLREQLGWQCDFAPDVPRLSGTQRSVFRNVLPIPEPRQPNVWGPVGTRGSGAGIWDVLQRAWGEDHSGARVHSGRRSRSARASTGDADVRLLEAKDRGRS